MRCIKQLHWTGSLLWAYLAEAGAVVVCAFWRGRCSLPGTPSSGKKTKIFCTLELLSWKRLKIKCNHFPTGGSHPWIMGAPSCSPSLCCSSGYPKTPAQNWAGGSTSVTKSQPAPRIHLQVPGPFPRTELPIQKQHRSPRLVFQGFLLNSHGHTGIKDKRSISARAEFHTEVIKQSRDVSRYPDPHGQLEQGWHAAHPETKHRKGTENTLKSASNLCETTSAHTATNSQISLTWICWHGNSKLLFCSVWTNGLWEASWNSSQDIKKEASGDFIKTKN